MYFNTAWPPIQTATQQLHIFLTTAKDHIFPFILAQRNLVEKKPQEVESYYSFEEI